MTPVPARRVLALAVPALGVLAAEPLYLLVDTAVVGRLGAVALAALAVGSVVLVQVCTQLTFLSYGTTARAARLYGSGQRAAAVAEGTQASWLALGIGGVVVVAGQLAAQPLVRLLAGPGPVADAALGWLRIALFGAPFILVTLAGNGWMRGVQDTARPLRYVLIGNGISALLCPVLVHGTGPVAGMGLPGSAVANVVAQVLAAELFLRALVVEGTTAASCRPSWPAMLAQLTMGRDLVLRAAAFQACFLSATAVAARTSLRRQARTRSCCNCGPSSRRRATLISALAGFLPVVWASFVFDWGLIGIWSGLAAFMVLRLGFVLARAYGAGWGVTGAVRFG